MVDHLAGAIADGPLTIIERQDPRPLAGEVVVDVAACGVCCTDLHPIGSCS